MSYDTSLRIKAGGEEYGELFEVGNMTWNVGPMFVKALTTGGLEIDRFGAIDGMKARNVLPALRIGLADMIIERREYESLNPQNGWGSYEGARNYLERLLEGCEKFPDAEIHVC